MVNKPQMGTCRLAEKVIQAANDKSNYAQLCGRSLGTEPALPPP